MMSSRSIHRMEEEEGIERHQRPDETEEFTKLGHTKKQVRQMRRINTYFQSPPLLQRLFILRKDYLIAICLSVLLCLVAVHRQIKSTSLLQWPPLQWPLPSVALKRMLPSTPMDKPKASFDSESGWQRVSYFAEIPSVDDPLWPPLPEDPPIEKNYNGSDLPSIATCVPGLGLDVYDETKVSNFLLSNQRQYVRAQELIFLFSDIDGVLTESGLTLTGEQWCQDAFKILQDFHSNLIVVCVGERITAGLARNVLARVATSDILAYIDTDDEEEPDRNQVIQETFACNSNLKLLLHSNYGTGHGLYGKVRYHPYDSLASTTAVDESTSVSTSVASASSCPDEQEGVEVIRGLELREMLDQSQEVLKFGIRTVGGMRPGHLVVKREVTRYVRSSSIYKGQDTLWARDIIFTYGRHDDVSMFLNRPLSTYYQSSHSFNINVKNR